MSRYVFLKSAFLPGTLGLLLATMSVCVVWLWLKRGNKAALWALSAVTAFYVVISSPRAARFITRLVADGYYTRATEPRLRGAQAIVVLDGGTARASVAGSELASPGRESAERALEALRVYRLLGGRTDVLVTGGAFEPAGPMPEGGAIRDFLIARGVPPERIVLDTTSHNTREHARNVPRLLAQRGDSVFVLVTSAVHMRRAMRAFNEAGSHPLAAPAVLDTPNPPSWWPSSSGLDESSAALYELFGFVFGH